MKYFIKSNLLLMLVGLLLVSCGNKQKREAINLPEPPTDIKYEAVTLIDGPLSGYVEIVPGSYLLELEKQVIGNISSSYSGSMKVKLKFIKPMEVKQGTGYNNYGPSLNGKALDEQGAPLDFELSCITDKDLATYLQRGTGEEWVKATLYSQGRVNKEEDATKMINNFKKGKKIRFNSEIVEEKFRGEKPASKTSEEKSVSSSGNCDEFLKGYEKFMQDYVSLLKRYKAHPNNTELLTDYTSMMTEANEWANKVKDCAGDNKYASKFVAIQMKISQALAK